MRRVKIRLAKDSIRQAIKATEQARDQIREQCDEFCKKTAQAGQAMVIQNIEEYDAIDTGTLVNGVDAYKKEDGRWVISVAADNGQEDNYAYYVEYGTGVKGKASPHPEASQVGWNYDINNHGNAGWKYPKRTGGFGITSGMPARPFFYDMKQELPEVANKIAAEVFKDD